MNIVDRIHQAVKNLKADTHFIFYGTVIDEENFNKISWITGENEKGEAITTTTNPHSELTWTKVKAEMDKLETEYDNQQYARNRKAEYPSIEELVVALYDTDDKAAIDSKRAEIKLKYPKP